MHSQESSHDPHLPTLGPRFSPGQEAEDSPSPAPRPTLRPKQITGKHRPIAAQDSEVYSVADGPCEAQEQKPAVALMAEAEDPRPDQQDKNR